MKPGDKVETIDDVIRGTVTGMNGEQVTLATEDGFELQFLVSELVIVSDTPDIRVSNIEAARAKTEKETRKKKPVTVKPKERYAPKMEVDLHIHQLVPSSRHMTKHEMLNIQLETAKRQLDFAIRKRIQKVVFIHGVGEGVLKEELKYLFGRYENIKYYDADYKKYGMGATEIYIYQNP
ncbi:MAG: DNA mismatch repair protein MutS [Eudoraea sp.]|nr:DNA mismatch repair protein MutS [Eudoraea sp.]